MGPAIEDRVNECSHLLRRKRAAGGVVDRHQIDAIDVDVVGHLTEVLRARVHVGAARRQKLHRHTKQSHLVHRAGKRRDGYEHGGRVPRTGTVSACLRHTLESGLQGLITAVEDHDLRR